MRNTMVLIAVLLMAIVAMALPGPDLSGKWTLDKAKSDPMGMGRGGPGGGGGAPGGPPPNVDVMLVIKQTATDITMQRTMVVEGIGDI